jgi:hypothetical protein
MPTKFLFLATTLWSRPLRSLSLQENVAEVKDQYLFLVKIDNYKQALTTHLRRFDQPRSFLQFSKTRDTRRT